VGSPAEPCLYWRTFIAMPGVEREVSVATASAPSVGRLVLVPALITLAVTLLRLSGELLGWSPLLVNRAPGGPGALIGIVWLVPVFGAWFGLRLARAGQAPAGVGRVAGHGILAVLAGAALSAAGPLLGAPPPVQLAGLVLGTVAAVAVAWRGWPALGRVLLAYALAARIPVALVMLAAILGDWGTHYDVVPPGFDATMGPLAKWVFIGLVPQLTAWVGFTVAVGTVFGAAGAALARRQAASPADALGPVTG